MCINNNWSRSIGNSGIRRDHLVFCPSHFSRFVQRSSFAGRPAWRFCSCLLRGVRRSRKLHFNCSKCIRPSYQLNVPYIWFPTRTFKKKTTGSIVHIQSNRSVHYAWNWCSALFEPKKRQNVNPLKRKEFPIHVLRVSILLHFGFDCYWQWCGSICGSNVVGLMKHREGKNETASITLKHHRHIMHYSEWLKCELGIQADMRRIEEFVDRVRSK